MKIVRHFLGPWIFSDRAADRSMRSGRIQHTSSWSESGRSSDGSVVRSSM